MTSFVLAIIVLCISLVSIFVIVIRKISVLATIPETDNRIKSDFQDKIMQGRRKAELLLIKKSKRFMASFANIKIKKAPPQEKEKKSFADDFWKDMKEN
jgi:ABC-type siderophore export system fused ATPase/permease subunit